MLALFGVVVCITLIIGCFAVLIDMKVDEKAKRFWHKPEWVSKPATNFDWKPPSKEVVQEVVDHIKSWRPEIPPNMTRQKTAKPKTITKEKKVSVHDFAVLITKKEGKKVSMNIGQIKEVLKLANQEVDGALYKAIRKL